MSNDIIKSGGHQIAPMSKELEQDFSKTSSNLETLIGQGNEGLNAALELLVATEATPRTVESFASLLKTVAELNLRYLDVQKSKANMMTGGSNNSNSPSEAKIVTNTQYVFNGSTEDLSKMVADISSKK